MAYNLCFICSKKIQGYFEYSNKKQSAAGTLCELLGLQLSDNTFTFGPKFQQAPYCPQCVSKMKEVRQMLNQLKELKIKIAEEKYILENKLNETCTRRGKLQVNLDDDEDDDGENCLHPFDRFREEVVKEIGENCPTSRNSNNSSPKANFQLKKTEDESSQYKKEIIQPGKRLNVSISRPEVKQSANEVSTTASPLRRGSRRRIFSVKDVSAEVEEPETITGYMNDEFTPEVIVTTDTSVITDQFTGLEQSMQVEDDPISVGFIDIVYGNDPPEVDVDQDGSDEDVERGSDDQEIYVNSTEDGKFQCPYAPVCEITFDPADRTEFLQHVRTVHKGKVPVTGSGTEQRGNTTSPQATTSNAGVEGKRITCKFCSESLSSITHLKAHYASQHEDEEWTPGNVSEQPRRKRRRSPTIKPIPPDEAGERRHKCQYCPATFKRSHVMVNHTRRRHTGERPYKCDKCTESFCVRRDLTYHQFKAHDIGKALLCPNCTKKFLYAQMLTVHLRSCGQPKM